MRGPTFRQGIPACALLVLIAALLIAPTTAAVKYTQGSSEFSAVITGTNEFAPGDEAILRVLVKNNGVNLVKQVNGGTIAQEDLPNTAKFVTVALGSETPLISVRTDPQFAGTIPGGGSVTKEFTVKISLDATDHEYPLPLSISYQYPVVLVQETSDSFHFLYDQRNITIPLTVRIRPGVRTGIVEVTTENLSTGSEGYILLKVRNEGKLDGKDAVLTVTRNGKSPVIPLDSSVYIGDFPAGGIAACRYRVAVSDSASAETYPADVIVSYKDHEGSAVTASPVTIGVPVAAKPAFSVTSAPPDLLPGQPAMITVTYRNTGTIPVSDAQAGLTVHDPFTAKDHVAYLGDIGPGGEKTASFVVQAGPDTGPGEYILDGTVRFRDPAGISIESDTVAVRVTVLPAARGTPALPVLPIIAGVIVLAVVILGAVMVVRHRKGAR